MKVYDYKQIPAPWRGKDATMTVVDIGINYVGETKDGSVYWGPNASTYCLVRRVDEPSRAYWTMDGIPVELVSIHGNGEVRWDVWPSFTCDHGAEGAIEYFTQHGMKRTARA